MRWFVQVSTIGKKAPADKLCLEGPHWQAALLAARKQRDEAPGLAGLSVEFDGAGCVAIDPATRARYQVEPAPDDAPLTAAGAPAAVAATPVVAAPEVAPAASPAESPASKRRARGKTVAFSSAGAVKAAQTEAVAALGAAAPEVVAPAPPAPAAVAMAPAAAAAPPVSVTPASAAAGEATAPSRRVRARTVGLSSQGEVLAADVARAVQTPAASVPLPEPAATAAALGAAPTMPAIPPAVLAALMPEPPADVAPAAAEVAYQVLASRAVEPSAQSPLAYRERVFAVTQPISPAELDRFMRARLVDVQQELESAVSGKVVNLALFDHVFSGRPERPPIVTLSWKDWRGDEPTIVFSPYGPSPIVTGALQSTPPPPLAGVTRSAPPPGSSAPAPASAPPAPAPAAPPPAPPAPAAARPPSSPPPAARSRSEPAPAFAAAAPPAGVPAGPPSGFSAGSPAPFAPVPSVVSQGAAPVPRASSAPAPGSQPRPATAAKGAPSRPGLRPQPAPPVPAEERARTYLPKAIPADAPRVTGDDLLTDLFEAMSDLHFLAGAFEGADFVLDLALQKLPCAVGVLSLFDMNRREFVVVRQVGGGKSGLLYRLPEGNRVAQTAMRSGRAQLVPAAEAALDGKWAQIGVAPTSLACAPIEHGGRYLGLIELCNPVDGRPFSDSDGHALTYIGRQYGEFLAERSVVLEPETVMQGLA